MRPLRAVAMASPSVESAAEAFAAIALAAVACDGELANLEIRALRQQLEFRTPYRHYSEKTMGDLLDRLLAILRGEGLSTLVTQAVIQLEGAQRETALAMAANLIHADHIQTPEELSFLSQLAEQLELGAERATQILEVISVLHRDSLAG
ncbi:MAG: hypothetical protein RLZZ32_375 [Cyanobacteriota bacterium]